MKTWLVALWTRSVALLLLGSAVGVVGSLAAQDTTDPLAALPETVFTNALEAGPTNQAEPEAISADQAWRSFLQIQGQLDTALLALERNRRESEVTSQDNQKKINDSLKSIELVLQAQQEREILALRDSNRNMLVVAGIFAGVGFLSMFLTSLFHLRAMNRLTSIAAGMPLGRGPAPILEGEEERWLEMRSGPPAGQRLLQAIERLEKRVHELEHTPSLPEQSVAPTDTAAPQGGPEPESNGDDQLSVLLGKGQALLNLGQAQDALICFEQALAAHPRHAETLVKKGAALEKLNRLDEAIACYDQAIAANQSMTLAYLYKGGVYNRLERYNDALACYEQALKTQQPTVPQAPS